MNNGLEEFKRQQEAEMEKRNNLGLDNGDSEALGSMSDNSPEQFSNSPSASGGGPVGGGATSAMADDLTNKVQEKAGKLAKKAGKKVGDVAKKGAKKIGKAIGNAVKKAAAKVGAKAASALGQLLANPITWIVLGVLLLLLLILIAWNSSDSVSENNREAVEYKGVTIEIESNWQERLEMSYYATFSDYSYFYTVDDSSTVYQSGSQKNSIVDKYARESSFALSPKVIKYLDEELNDGLSFPEQLIKPVYNTCSTGEASDGYCKTKDLTNSDGELSVISQRYSQFEDCLTENSKTCGIMYKYDSNQNKIDTSKEVSVSSWGLAPILHYKKYEEKRWAQDLKVSNVRYYDEDKEEYKTCKYSECPDAIKNKLINKTDVKKVSDTGDISGDKINNDTVSDNKTDQTKKDVYLIDSVATTAGNVTNEVAEKTAKTGEIYSNEVVVTEETEKIIRDMSDKKLTDKEWTKNAVLIIQTSFTISKGDEKFKSFESWDPNGTSNNDWAIVFKNLNQNFLKQFFSLSMTPLSENASEGIEKAQSWSKIDTKIVTRETLSDCTSFTVSKDKTTYTCKKTDGTKKVIDTSDYSKITVSEGVEVTGVVSVSVEHDTGDVNTDNTAKTAKGVQCLKTYNTIYNITGDYWNTEYSYISNSPNTDDIDDGKYLKDYISNYEFYYSQNDWDEKYDEITKQRVFTLSYDEAEKAVNYNNTSKYYKTIETLYGNKVFLDYEAFIKARMAEIDNSNTSETSDYTGEIALGEKASDYNICVQKLNVYKVNGNETAYKAMERYSSYYGVDISLMVAIAMREGSCNTGMWNLTFAQTQTSAYGVFQMKMSQWLNKNISSFNYLTNSTDTLTINKAGGDENIHFAIMYIANLVKSYNGNVLMALQSYNFGGGSVDAVLSAYATASGISKESLYQKDYLYDLGWMAYRNIINNGDKQYVENVLRYLPTDHSTLTFKLNSAESISYDIAKATGITNNYSSYEDSTIKEIYWYKNKSLIYSNWDMLYPFKSKDSITIEVKKNEFPAVNTSNDNNTKFLKIKRKEFNDNITAGVLAKMFSALDGTLPSENMELTENEWRKKFTTLFTAIGGIELDADTPSVSEYFRGYPRSPLENNFAVARPFGYSSLDANSKKQKNTDILMKGTSKEKVYAITSGTVSQIVKSCVTIEHSNGSGIIKHQVETEYCYISPSKDLKVGNEIKDGDVIGTLKGNTDISEENVYLSFSLIVDDSYEDGSWILKYLKKSKEVTEMQGLLNSTAVMKTNEASKALVADALANADKYEDKMNEFDVKDETILQRIVTQGASVYGITWYYNGINGDTHNGVDYSPSNSGCKNGTIYCNFLHTFADGILLSYSDGYTDNAVSSDNYGAANFAQVLYRGNNHHYYVLTSIHLHQGSTTQALSGLTSAFLEEGTWFGTTGNSGNSTGTHTHFEVVDYGPVSLKEFLTSYQTRVGTWGAMRANLNYNNTAHRCENTGAFPCVERPDKMLFKVSYKQWVCPMEGKKITSNLPTTLANNFCGKTY